MRHSLHADFLTAYAVPDMHYSFEDAPEGYIKNHPNITSDQIEHALRASHNAKMAALNHPSIQPHHLIGAFKRANDDRNKIDVINSPYATPEVLQHAIDNRSAHLNVAAASHTNTTPEQLHELLDKRIPGVTTSVLQNPKANASHINKVINDPDSSWGELAYAAKNPTVTREQLHKILGKSNHWLVQHDVTHSRNMPTDDLIELAKSHPSEAVRNYAKRSLESRGETNG